MHLSRVIDRKREPERPRQPLISEVRVYRVIGGLIFIQTALGGTALLENSAPAVHKIQGPSGPGFLYTAGAESAKRAAPPSTGGV